MSLGYGVPNPPACELVQRSRPAASTCSNARNVACRRRNCATRRGLAGDDAQRVSGVRDGRLPADVTTNGVCGRREWIVSILLQLRIRAMKSALLLSCSFVLQGSPGRAEGNSSFRDSGGANDTGGHGTAKTFSGRTYTKDGTTILEWQDLNGDMQVVRLGELLGQGSSGTVFAGTLVSTGQELVVKMGKSANLATERQALLWLVAAEQERRIHLEPYASESGSSSDSDSDSEASSDSDTESSTEAAGSIAVEKLFRFVELEDGQAVLLKTPILSCGLSDDNTLIESRSATSCPIVQSSSALATTSARHCAIETILHTAAHLLAHGVALVDVQFLICGCTGTALLIDLSEAHLFDPEGALSPLTRGFVLSFIQEVNATASSAGLPGSPTYADDSAFVQKTWSRALATMRRARSPQLYEQVRATLQLDLRG
ncbi:hypothetical protein FVE85_5138 [Porphyridium purpureum]|uniref:Protein kinase domain-containing protein n=1 Tax=Porphyridium purpureum TaxID=35688 RepID=A0A5J4Z3M6_PORPP|nr:hypothetical protein FVE85_5138 [Porphyridium purpureum]|eukprot:POR5869..scf295_1